MQLFRMRVLRYSVLIISHAALAAAFWLQLPTQTPAQVGPRAKPTLTSALTSPLSNIQALDQLEELITDVLEWPLGYNLKDNEEFEYVVVGAGAGGAAVAARLALAGRSVLLLEAGTDPPPLAMVPGAATIQMGTPVDWQYDTVPNNVSCLSSDGKQCRFSRGKMLGGSTSLNYMMYVRGNPVDYELGLPGWTWRDLRPYFLRYEGMRDLARLPPSSVPYHNTTGTVRVGYCDDPENEWHDRLFEGFQQLGIPFNADVNADSQIGVTRVCTYTANGERESTATAYLARPDVRASLLIAKGTRCTGVMLDEGNVATGVTAVRFGSGRAVTVRATRGVVLAAGAVATPQLLQLAGFGPRAVLDALGVPVRADLPVGENMSDHVLPLMFLRSERPALELLGGAALTGAAVLEYLKTRRGKLASVGLTDATAFLNTSCFDFEAGRLDPEGAGCELPSLQMIHAYLERGLVVVGGAALKRATGLSDDVVAQLAAESARFALVEVSPVVLAPRSRGWVRAATIDPLAPPSIFPNYFADERDVDEAVRGIKLLERLVETEAYRAMGASLVRLRLPGCPTYKADREGYWRCYVRHMTFSVFHAAGTAALGGVLDERLRVRGAHRLHVGDLSALPVVPHGNTAAAAIAIGERLADFLLDDYRDAGDDLQTDCYFD